MLSIQALHGPLAYANGPLCFRVDQKCSQRTCTFVVQRETLMMQNPICNEETPPPPPPPPPPQALRPQQFSALVAKYTLQDGIESDDDCFAGNETIIISKLRHGHF